MLSIIEKNPFRVLGVWSNARQADIIRNQSQLKAYLNVGKSLVFPSDLPRLLSPMERSLESIQEAQSAITLPIDKIRQALFWFMDSDSEEDQRALELIKQNRIALALKMLSGKAAHSVVSKINYAILCMITSNYRQALQNYAEIVHCDVFRTVFIKAICGDNYSLDEISFSHLFFDTIISQAEQNIFIGKKYELNIPFSLFSSMYQNTTVAPFINKIDGKRFCKLEFLRYDKTSDWATLPPSIEKMIKSPTDANECASFIGKNLDKLFVKKLYYGEYCLGYSKQITQLQLLHFSTNPDDRNYIATILLTGIYPHIEEIVNALGKQNVFEDNSGHDLLLHKLNIYIEYSDCFEHYRDTHITHMLKQAAKNIHDACIRSISKLKVYDNENLKLASRTIDDAIGLLKEEDVETKKAWIKDKELLPNYFADKLVHTVIAKTRKEREQKSDDATRIHVSSSSKDDSFPETLIPVVKCIDEFVAAFHPFLFDDYKQYIESTAPLIVEIRDVLGKTNPLYLQKSTDIVRKALTYLVNSLNNSSEFRFSGEVTQAYIIIIALSEYDMDPDYRSKTFGPNFSTIINLYLKIYQKPLDINNIDSTEQINVDFRTPKEKIIEQNLDDLNDINGIDSFIESHPDAGNRLLEKAQKKRQDIKLKQNKSKRVFAIIVTVIVIQLIWGLSGIAGWAFNDNYSISKFWDSFLMGALFWFIPPVNLIPLIIVTNRILPKYGID